MSRFLSWFANWFAGPGKRRPDPEIEALAYEMFQQLHNTPEPFDPKPRADDLVRQGLAKRSEPSNEQLAHLRAAIAGLTKRQREVLKLSSIDRLTYKQIAVRLDITEKVALRDLTAAYHALSMRSMPR